MKGIKTLLLLCLLFVLPVLVFSNEEEGGQGINKDQPISIGERIYKSEKAALIDGNEGIIGVAYLYDGSDVNSINIKIMRITICPSLAYIKEEPAEFKTYPLNPKKQALLKVETLNDAEPNKEILISIVDEFYRIRAEEYKKDNE